MYTFLVSPVQFQFQRAETSFWLSYKYWIKDKGKGEDKDEGKGEDKGKGVPQQAWTGPRGSR